MPDGNDVMGVVGNAAGQRAGLQAEALHVAEADVAGVMMPLDQRHFGDVARRVIAVGGSKVGGDQLVRLHAHHGQRSGGEAFLGDEGRAERVVRAGGQALLHLRLFHDHVSPSKTSLPRLNT